MAGGTSLAVYLHGGSRDLSQPFVEDISIIGSLFNCEPGNTQAEVMSPSLFFFLLFLLSITFCEQLHGECILIRSASVFGAFVANMLERSAFLFFPPPPFLSLPLSLSLFLALIWIRDGQFKNDGRKHLSQEPLKCLLNNASNRSPICKTGCHWGNL